MYTHRYIGTPHIYKQIDRHIRKYTQIDRHRHTYTNRQTHTHIHTQINRHMYTYIHADMQYEDDKLTKLVT